MKNKIYLCSFASSDLDLSVKRFLFQANKMNIYSDIKVYRPKDLSSELKKELKNYLKMVEKTDTMDLIYGDQK